MRKLFYLLAYVAALVSCTEKNNDAGAEKTGYAGFVNDLDGGAPFVPRYIKDGKMYQIMEATRFLDLAEKCSSQEMKKVASSMNEESNPVLIEVVLK